MYWTINHVLFNCLLMLIVTRLAHYQPAPAAWLWFVLGSFFPDLDRGGGIIAQEGRLLPRCLLYLRLFKILAKFDNAVTMKITGAIQRVKVKKARSDSRAYVGKDYFHSIYLVSMVLATGRLMAWRGSYSLLWFGGGWALHVFSTALTTAQEKYFFPLRQDRQATGFITPGGNIESAMGITVGVVVVLMSLGL